MIVLYAQGTLNDTPTTIVVALYGAPATSAVAGATTALAAATQTGSPAQAPISRLGIALQSLTPAAVASLVILMMALIIAPPGPNPFPGAVTGYGRPTEL